MPVSRGSTDSPFMAFAISVLASDGLSGYHLIPATGSTALEDPQPLWLSLAVPYPQSS